MVNRFKRMSKGTYIVIGLALLLGLLPLGIGDNNDVMHLFVLSFIWGVVASAWDLIMGYARVLSFGQLAFFALGGYTSAMLALYLGVSPYLGMLAGGGVALAIGLVVGLICLRLRGIYVGMVTFAIHLVLPTLFVAGDAIGTGGTYGLFGIPPLNIGEMVFSKLEMIPWYYAAFGLFAGFLALIYLIIRSPIGLAFVALRDSEPFAKRLGVNEYKYMVIVFGIAAFITGVAGGFYVHYMGVISPAIFRLEFFLFALVMVMLGGMARFPGAAIGAFVVTFINDAARTVGMARLTILGAIVVAVMLVLPDGLIGIPELINRYRGKAQEETLDSPIPNQEE